MADTCVYTAIFGGKDTFTDFNSHFLPPNVDLLCFTDNPDNVKVKRCQVIKCDGGSNPCLEAKRYKILPHVFLPVQYKRSIWVDGNMSLLKNPVPLFDEMQEDIAFFRHHQTGCIYEQAKLCVKLKKVDRKEVDKQMSFYYNFGYPTGIEGVACYIIFRNHNKTYNAMNEWMKEIRRWTLRDQLSFPFIAWRDKVKYDAFPTKVFGEYFLRRKHR